MSDLIHAGDWPLWYPYARYGFPLTTLQFAANYTNPVGAALAALFPYGIWTLAVENTIWRIVGLTGAYFFTRRHVRSPLGAATVACCYMGSGTVAMSVLNGTVFAGLAIAPWLLFAIDEAILGERRQAWGRATATLALTAAGLILSGYPGTWLTAPFLVLPYGLWMSASSWRAFARLATAALLGAGLAFGILALFVSETLGFPQLFGGLPRNVVSPSLGVFLPTSLFGLWLANPTYAFGLNVANLQPIYVGVIPALLLCARCTPWGNRRLAWLRPLALVAGALLLLGASAYPRDIAPYSRDTFDTGVTSNPVAAAFIAANLLTPAHVVTFGILLLAIGAFPRSWGRWERTDAALLITTVSTLLAASPNPVGDFLRSHVPPFSLVRWNYLFLWVIGLTVPLLAWRTAEQMIATNARAIPPRNQRLRAWAKAWVPAVGLLAAISLLAIAAPPGVTDGEEGRDPERVGTIVTIWQSVLVFLMAAGTALYYIQSRKPDRARRPAVWFTISSLLVLIATLFAGWLLSDNEPVVRSYIYLPPGGRHILDITQQAIVLTALAIAALTASTWREFLRGLAVVAVLDVGLAGTRYLSDSHLLVAQQGPAHTSYPRQFTFTGTNRSPSDQDANSPLVLKQPSMWIWTGLVPHVGEFDQWVGEPSIFDAFAHFPVSWHGGDRADEVVVERPEQLRSENAGPPPRGAAENPGVHVPACSGARGTSGTRPEAIATVTRMLSSIVQLDVVADCERLMVYTDTWAPGWQVWVDGERAQALRVNGAIRGVMVPAGRHTVEWRYRPRNLGLLLSIMATCFLAAVALVLLPWLDTRFGRKGGVLVLNHH